MREIKFRGKRTFNGEWLYGDLLRVNEQTMIHPHFAEPYEYPEDFDENVDPKTVGQLIGLKDCDGRDIYEGDLVSSGEHTIYRVDWLQSHAQYFFKVIKTESVLTKELRFPVWQYAVDGKCGVEVIGNIYENPDLTEPAKDQ